MNAQDFIDFFQAIPDEKWTTGTYSNVHGQRCAFGHCFDKDIIFETRTDAKLVSLFGRITALVTEVNDGKDPRFQQSAPKARILAALEEIKKHENQIHS